MGLMCLTLRVPLLQYSSSSHTSRDCRFAGAGSSGLFNTAAMSAEACKQSRHLTKFAWACHWAGLIIESLCYAAQHSRWDHSNDNLPYGTTQQTQGRASMKQHSTAQHDTVRGFKAQSREAQQNMLVRGLLASNIAAQCRPLKTPVQAEYIGILEID